MRAGNWTPLQWFNPKLAHVANEVGALPNLIAVDNICKLDHNDVSFSTNFEYGDVKDKSNPYRATKGNGNAFCLISESVLQTIDAEPQFNAVPQEGKEDKAKSIWKKASRLLIAVRFSTTSTRPLAIYSKKPAMGGMFVAVQVSDPEQEKAFAAFLNSSFGILQLLNRRSKKLTYIRHEVAQLKTVMLPDPTKANLTPLLAAFEKVKDIPLEKLANCAIDPSRKILDHAAAKAIGVDPKLTDQWRKWLSQEPTITNKPYGG